MGEVIATGHNNQMFKGPQASELGVFFKVSDLLLSNDLLMTFDTKEKFNDYLTYLYGTNIVTNHLLESDYSYSPTFSESSDDNLGGVGLKYGNATSPVAGTSSPTTLTWSIPTLLEIQDLTIPRHIDLSFQYANSADVMGMFEIRFKTAKSEYSLVYMEDEYYPAGSGWNLYTNNRTSLYSNYTSGTQHVKLSLDVADMTNCFTDGETTGSLIISAAKNVAGYTTNYIFIKELNILFT